MPYPHKVPTELQSAVENALKIPVDFNPAPGDQYSITLGNQSHNKGDNINLADFDLGLTKTTYSDSTNEEYSSKGNVKIYRQHYSVIMAILPTEGKLVSNNQNEQESDIAVSLSMPIGYFTENIPTAGKATYLGTALFQNEEGNLNLDVDFGNNTVNGEITGLSSGKITLNEGVIAQTEIENIQDEQKTVWGYSGDATLSDNGKLSVKTATVTKNGIASVSNTDMTADKYNLTYDGAFFGPKAEETVGHIWAKNKTDQNDDANFTDVIGFAGQRGEIKK